jgi:hypothetical protein
LAQRIASFGRCYHCHIMCGIHSPQVRIAFGLPDQFFVP